MSAGLKDLSLKVMEQVIKDKTTTYADVAHKIVGILMQNGHASSMFGDEADEEEDSNSLGHQESDDAKKNENEPQDKREKNIRRRVYDALNVQLAAGVLIKKDKKISPNFECKEFKRIFANLKLPSSS